MLSPYRVNHDQKFNDVYMKWVKSFDEDPLKLIAIWTVNLIDDPKFSKSFGYVLAEG
jgi:hypothetical protein